MDNHQESLKIANEIIDLLINHGGSEYIGEPVTKLEHSVQSAMIAEEIGLDDELIIAALLHDIGHICVEKSEINDMNGYGVMDHEFIGAQFLKEKGFSDRIVEAVANHVPAKRYLCYKHVDYFDALSDASKNTLKFQGGPMSEMEAAKFESNLYFEDIIQIRKIDEIAKIENAPMPLTLNHYREKIIKLITK
jgi:putative nucleotidyltransferase with HDIG domain